MCFTHNGVAICRFLKGNNYSKFRYTKNLNAYYLKLPRFRGKWRVCADKDYVYLEFSKNNPLSRLVATFLGGSKEHLPSRSWFLRKYAKTFVPLRAQFLIGALSTKEPPY